MLTVSSYVDRVELPQHGIKLACYAYQQTLRQSPYSFYLLLLLFIFIVIYNNNFIGYRIRFFNFFQVRINNKWR